MILAIFIITLLISFAVVIHYEFLRMLSKLIPNLSIKPRLKVLVGMFGILIAHVIEISMFGLAYFWMINYAELGSLVGNFSGTFSDCVYFSFANYTSLGYGDIQPLGHLRFLAAMEALTGLGLIAWSASFTFIEMSKLWD